MSLEGGDEEARISNSSNLHLKTPKYCVVWFQHTFCGPTSANPLNILHPHSLRSFAWFLFTLFTNLPSFTNIGEAVKTNDLRPGRLFLHQTYLLKLQPEELYLVFSTRSTFYDVKQLNITIIFPSLIRPGGSDFCRCVSCCHAHLQNLISSVSWLWKAIIKSFSCGAAVITLQSNQN